MRIGITYDLRDEYLRQGFTEQETAEFDGIETIDAIDEVLRGLSHETQRIGNLLSLIDRIHAGERWDLVFNIAEGMYGYAREAQVPALLDAFQIPYTFSDPLMLSLSLHKALCKRVVQGLGIPTPAFAVVNSSADVDTVDLPWPVFAKPVAGGTSMGVSAASKITDKAELVDVCSSLLQQFRQPVLVETFLPGREFTIGVVGTGTNARVLGVMEVFLHGDAEPDVYSYANKKNYQGRVRYRLAEDEAARQAGAFALQVWNGLGCRDAGRLDFRCDAAGSANFLEVNPLAGLHPVDSDLVVMCGFLGIRYETLIGWILQSALERTA